MKRHASLRTLSHDHHHGLVQAKRLCESAHGDNEQRAVIAEGFAVAWRDQILPHFEREERVLLPYLKGSEEGARLLDEHAKLRSLIEGFRSSGSPEPSVCGELGKMLEEHIRWEERELFPRLEQSLPEDALHAIGMALERATR